MPGRLTAIGRVVGGLGGLLVLVVGVPALLAVTVGWPLPRSLPTWEEVLSALSGSSVSDGTILKTIAVVGWLAWMQVLVSTVVEAHAWMQGRVAASVPLAGPVQAVIRRLLLSALLLGGPVRAVSLTTEPAPALAVL
ncbi:MAG: hypothetical protein KY447_09080, partial [Actinobacteria bacterium]|nr:hypothetical protein [Actinomycetota bacterium]